MALNFVHQMDALKEQDINNIKGTKKRLVLMGYQEDADSPASTSSFVVDLPELANIIHATGPQGVQGAQGAKGRDGIGVSGPQGATGAQGPRGLQGPAGGGSGSGAQGPAGPQGTTGAQGPKGDGSTITIDALKNLGVTAIANALQSVLDARYMRTTGSNANTNLHFGGIQGTVTVQAAAFYEDGTTTS